MDSLIIFGLIENNDFETFLTLFEQYDKEKDFLKFSVRKARINFIRFFLNRNVDFSEVSEDEVSSECSCLDCRNYSASGIAERLIYDDVQTDSEIIKEIIELFHSLKPYPNIEAMRVFRGWAQRKPIEPQEKKQREELLKFVEDIQEAYYDGIEKLSIDIEQLNKLLVHALRARNPRAVGNLIYIGAEIPNNAFQEIIEEKAGAFFRRQNDSLKTLNLLLWFIRPKNSDINLAFWSGNLAVLRLLLKHFNEHVTIEMKEVDKPEKYGLLALEVSKHNKKFL